MGFICIYDSTQIQHSANTLKAYLQFEICDYESWQTTFSVWLLQNSNACCGDSDSKFLSLKFDICSVLICQRYERMERVREWRETEEEGERIGETLKCIQRNHTAEVNRNF